MMELKENKRLNEVSHPSLLLSNILRLITIYTNDITYFKKRLTRKTY